MQTSLLFGCQKGFSEHDIYSALALFNSSWFVVAMEEYGTVMGGGALKLECNSNKENSNSKVR